MLIKIHRYQKGQALPIGMALFLVLGLMSFVLFNTGQTVSDKSRLVNTADSAVYSGLLWQARAMNFQAYTNRAMVANQVAMAQAVSINSWSAYLAKTGLNLNTAFGWVPYVGVVTQIIDNVSGFIDAFLNPISKGMLSVVNAVNASLSIAQEAMYYSSFVATPDVISSVVKSNEPTDLQGESTQKYKWETAFSLANVAVNLKEWKNFTESSSGDNQALAENERFHMINASLDKFSKDRSWKFLNMFIPLTPITWYRFEKAGTTKLYRKDGKYELYAKDAFSLRQRLYTFWGTKHSDIPIAGASTVANTDGSENSIMGDDAEFFKGRHYIAKAREDINRFHVSEKMGNYGGIQAYRSLSSVKREEDRPSMILRIQISMKSSEIVDSDDLISTTDGEGFNASVKAPGGVMSSVSTAELYFKRPCFDEECIKEFANGYSPYWAVRLTNTSGLSRLASHTLEFGDVATLTNAMTVLPSSLNRLPAYSATLATPLDDYKEQSKGLSVMADGMESHLLTLVEGTAEYQQYIARIENLEANITSEISSIADHFMVENLSEGQLIEEIAKVAGYDLDIDEFSTITSFIEKYYPDLDAIRDLTIDGVKDHVEEFVDQTVDDLTESVKDELTDILADAVQNILSGMVSSFSEQIAGTDVFAAVTDTISDRAAEDLLETAQASLEHSKIEEDDIEIDVSDECSIWDAVQETENVVEGMQQRLININEQIAVEFQAVLETTTADTVAERNRIEAEIAVINTEIDSLNSFTNHTSSDEKEDLTADMNRQITRLESTIEGLADARVESLANDLMVISDEATKDEFTDYSLSYRYAERAVIETLGDTEIFVVDEDGQTVSENMILGAAVSAMDSDNEQSEMELPEGC